MIVGRSSIVLVDTGFSRADFAEDRLGVLGRGLGVVMPEFTALEHLHRRGLRPEDVSDIVMTHLDFDHTGGLSDFPQATVHVSRKELDVALEPRGKDRLRYLPVHYADRENWNPVDLDGATAAEWFGFPGAIQLELSGVEVWMIPTYGHSAGHAAIAVRGADGWVLHGGDVCYAFSELQTLDKRSWVERAFRRSVDADPAAAVQQRLALREFVARHPEVQVVLSHDAP